MKRLETGVAVAVAAIVALTAIVGVVMAMQTAPPGIRAQDLSSAPSTETGSFGAQSPESIPASAQGGSQPPGAAGSSPTDTEAAAGASTVASLPRSEPGTVATQERQRAAADTDDRDREPSATVEIYREGAARAADYRLLQRTQDKLEFLRRMSDSQTDLLPLFQQIVGSDPSAEVRKAALAAAAGFPAGESWRGMLEAACADWQPPEVRLQGLDLAASRLPALLERYARDADEDVRLEVAALQRDALVQKAPVTPGAENTR